MKSFVLKEMILIHPKVILVLLLLKLVLDPGGYLIAPKGGERLGDLAVLIFSNSWIKGDNGDVYIYYGVCDTITYVVTITVEKLLDYATHTPEDGSYSAKCVE